MCAALLSCVLIFFLMHHLNAVRKPFGSRKPKVRKPFPFAKIYHRRLTWFLAIEFGQLCIPAFHYALQSSHFLPVVQ